MNKFKEGWLNIVAVVFIMLVFFQTCGVKGRIMDNEDRIKSLQETVDSLHKVTADQMITEAEMIRLIKETPAWKTLRIEEISDKEKISINALEEKEK
jgi:cell division protein FtsB